MSIKATQWVWDNAKDIHGTDFIMLLAIANHINGDGECWPSVATLADLVHIKTRQAQYIIGRLESLGYLTIQRGTGRGRPSTYRINESRTAPERVQSDCTDYAGKRVQSDAQKGAISEPKGCSLAQERVQSGDIKGAVVSHAREESTTTLTTLEPKAAAAREEPSFVEVEQVTYKTPQVIDETDFKILIATAEKAGLVFSQLLAETYADALATYGLRAMLYGVEEASKAGAIQRVNYVLKAANTHKNGLTKQQNGAMNGNGATPADRPANWEPTEYGWANLS